MKIYWAIITNIIVTIMIITNLVLHYYCDYEVDQKLRISDQFLYFASSYKQNNRPHSILLQIFPQIYTNLTITNCWLQ